MKKADYKYNIRGWLTGINDISNLQQISGPNDLFAFKINYTQTHQNYGSEVTPLYNGNIAETLWRSGSDNILRSYGYAYDPMNRLTNAIYGRPNSGVKLTHNYNEWLTYDANGNILTLGRNGISDSHNNLILIDNLDYHYKDGNSNILVSVDDLSDNDAGFKKGNTTQEDDFEYDANGNLIIDRNKDITQITYNHLNLPVKIVFDNNSNKYIEYLYTATGQKTQKRVKHLDSTSITKYLHGFQYYDGVLQFFHTPEGYVKNTPHDNGTPSFDYVYQYRDHLGNVRINYAQDPQTGDLAILDENHYYPFGLRHTNYNSDRLDIKRIENQEKGLVDENPPHLPVANRGYQYKFNGKELQSEFGVNIYDFGFRNYDPALGRWMNIDPMAEKMRRHSPYNYAFNNPIFWIDPDGMVPQVHVIGSDSKGGVDLTGALHQVNAIVARNKAEGMFDDLDKINKDFAEYFQSVSSSNKAGSGDGGGENSSSNQNEGDCPPDCSFLQKVSLFVSDNLVRPFVEVPQVVIVPVINQINIIRTEGAHSGRAYDQNNVLIKNTYYFENWSFVKGKDTQSTGTPTWQEGQRMLNNTLGITPLGISTRFGKVVDFSVENIVIKPAVGKIIDEIE